MYYKKNSDKREVKCILHEISDVPNGVTINTELLGGDILREGTPIGKQSDGKYAVLKTAKLMQTITGGDTKIMISKEHHFKVGDYITDGTAPAQQIKAIDKSDKASDAVTLGKALGEVTEGAVLYETTSGATDMKVVPTAIVGKTDSVEAGIGIETSALIRCDIRESIAPPVNEAIKKQLHLVAYI